MSFKLLLLQLGFTCGTAADRLRLILRFSVFTSVQSGFSSFFFGCFYFGVRGNLLIYTKNINFSSFLERPIETSRRNTVSRHRDNVHGYDN